MSKERKVPSWLKDSPCRVCDGPIHEDEEVDLNLAEMIVRHKVCVDREGRPIESLREVA